MLRATPLFDAVCLLSILACLIMMATAAEARPYRPESDCTVIERRGDAEAAENHFRAALDLGRPDAYLLDAYGDFLLDRDRTGEVRRLFERTFG